MNFWVHCFTFITEKAMASFSSCSAPRLPIPCLIATMKIKAHLSAANWRREQVLRRHRSIAMLALVSWFFVFAMMIFTNTLHFFLPDTSMFDETTDIHRGLSLAVDSTTQYPTVVKTTFNERLTNRTLVIVLGDLRCGNKAWDTLYKQVLDHNQADLALFTQKPSQLHYANASILERAMHVEMVPNYSDWADALDLVENSPAWRDRVGQYYNPTSHPSLLGGVKGYFASGAIVNMYKWFAAQRILERNWLDQYDRFVVTRTDQYYDYPLDLASMDPRYMWIPEGEDYGGITDRFFIASAPFVVSALDTITPFLKEPGRFRWQFKDAFAYYGPFKVNCEKYLWYLWKFVGLTPKIRRFKRGFFTCMAPGDTSRWGKMEVQVEEGVYLKYPVEYKETKNRKKPRPPLVKLYWQLYERVLWFGF